MMPKYDLQVFPDAQSLYRGAAEKITSTIEAALQKDETATVVLTGGNTPKPVYELLATSPYRERISWQRIDFFWGDERCVPPDSSESNYKMAWESLLSRVPVAQPRIHRIPGELEDNEKAARAYEAAIGRVLPDAEVPRFDLVLLGMGDDGHTASLFPGTAWDEARLVVSNHVSKLRATRITMTPRLLNAARAIIFLASGSGKASVLARVLEDPANDSPAKRILPSAGSLTWLVDREAAALLSVRER